MHPPPPTRKLFNINKKVYRQGNESEVVLKGVRRSSEEFKGVQSREKGGGPQAFEKDQSLVNEMSIVGQ